jgi:hypothetical protein
MPLQEQTCEEKKNLQAVASAPLGSRDDPYLTLWVLALPETTLIANAVFRTCSTGHDA